AEVFQPRAHRLLGERRVAQPVTTALQADHQAIADEPVVARALPHPDALEAGYGRRRQSGRDGKHQRKRKTVDHDVPPRTVPSDMTVPRRTAPLSTFRTRMRSPTDPGCSGTPVTEMVSAPWT